MVSLNRAVAVAMVHGPAAGLDLIATLETDERMARHHRPHATRAHMLELLGEHEAAVAPSPEAARRTTSTPSVATSVPAPTA
ncbi:hypothetical protein [Streptomyces sp. AC512_CC834]|uniref:hypothetical protein n=1 Tax=Streptomyces sp. AC512_CC834 TaxID=2823691 RepID=UPI001C26EC3D|nr:hypothetical protein [Streptomyces sp. AC512_CC834]